MNLLRKLSVAGLALALSMAVGNADVAVYAQAESGLTKESSTDSINNTEETPRQKFIADATTDSAQKKAEPSENQGPKTAKITGIGGVFFKSNNNNKELAQWYQKNLGLKLEAWGGAALHWTEDKAEDKGVTAWLAAKKDTTLFSPSSSSFMINYRIDDMDAMIAQLKRNGVAIQKGPESYENGNLFLGSIKNDDQLIESKRRGKKFKAVWVNKEQLTVGEPAKDQLLVEGKFNRHDCQVKLHRIDEKEMPLLKQGFRWVTNPRDYTPH